jgi:hypothetical protein
VRGRGGSRPRLLDNSIFSDPGPRCTSPTRASAAVAGGQTGQYFARPSNLHLGSQLEDLIGWDAEELGGASG